jgi:tetratricopeptide (TPR) repeat protein
MLAMSNRTAAVATALAVLLAVPMGPARAQAPQPPGQSQPKQQPQPKQSPQQSQPQQKQAPQASPQPAPPSSQRSALPKTPAEREKMLSDLYALLATADEEDSAKAISEAIERIWLHSGSATIDVLMERAMKAVADKKLDLAMRLLNHVVALAPDYTEAWNRRAYVYFVQNDVEHALGDLRRALALDPNHFKALDGLAQILREIGQKKPALKAFRQLLEVHPYWSGAKSAVEELERDVDGQGI